MSINDLWQRTVLVVGASTGVGRAVARRAVDAGAQVAFCARRTELLEEAVAESGGGLVVTGDVSDADDCVRIVDQVQREIGPVDLLLHTAAMSSLVRMEDCDDASWSQLVATNLIGFNLICRAAVTAMVPGGVIAAISSESVGSPLEGLGPYSATKAALAQSVLAWRMEHPELRFSVVTIGGTTPTGFSDGFNAEVFARARDTWFRWGQVQRERMGTNELADVLADVLGTVVAHPGVAMEGIRLRHPSHPAGAVHELLDQMPS